MISFLCTANIISSIIWRGRISSNGCCRVLIEGNMKPPSQTSTSCLPDDIRSAPIPSVLNGWHCTRQPPSRSTKWRCLYWWCMFSVLHLPVSSWLCLIYETCRRLSLRPSFVVLIAEHDFDTSVNHWEPGSTGGCTSTCSDQEYYELQRPRDLARHWQTNAHSSLHPTLMDDSM